MALLSSQELLPSDARSSHSAVPDWTEEPSEANFEDHLLIFVIGAHSTIYVTDNIINEHYKDVITQKEHLISTSLVHNIQDVNIIFFSFQRLIRGFKGLEMSFGHTPQFLYAAVTLGSSI